MDGLGQKAVFFHQGALGDFILAAAAIDEVARSQGFTRVDFWSKVPHVSLLSAKPYMGQCLPCDSPLASRLLHETLWRRAKLPDFLLNADRIFIFGQSGSRLMAERLSERLAAAVNWLQSFPPPHASPEHVCDFLRAQFGALALPISGKPLALSPPAPERRAARQLLHQLGVDSTPVLVHPGSGGLRKVWPLANWHGLIDRIRREADAPVVLSVGPADEYLLEFSGFMQKSGVPLIHGLTPLGLSGLLSLCGLYIGSDSGVSHLAGAVGVPTITIFGPSDPAVWAPRGSRTVALRRNWKEEDVLRWTPSDKPDFEDEEIMNAVKTGFDGK